MAHSSVRIAAAVALALASFSSIAQDITFSGISSDGLPVQGSISANTTQQASLQETLADGTRHNRFLLYPNGQFGIEGSWLVQVGAKAIGAYVEAYEHAGDIPIGPVVDAYLTPDGRSSLSLAWQAYPSCHGGCITTARIRLDLASGDGSLFGSSIDSGVFQRYASGSGFVSTLSEYGGQEPFTYRAESHFTLSAVPEPQSWLTAAIGLAGVALASRLRPARPGATRIGQGSGQLRS